MSRVTLQDPRVRVGDGTMSDEVALRERLGIPTDAAEVVVVAESTHWDPNWLLTSAEYLRGMVVPTLDAALDALAAEPRRVYSVECAFFPAAYLAVRPERRETFVRFANQGRLQFTGSGVTTPDTLLPEDEALLRDLLEGSRWLRQMGITTEPRTLYLPDSFGHSPGLPALLRAAGVDRAAICRIDGMRFPGAELESADHFPWPGTSAERLAAAGSADFRWRSPDGAEVLCHWHAFGYGHGDMIGHGGFTRVMGLPLAWPSRHPGKVAARIEQFVDQLRPLSPTPYHLLAIGFDFSRPVPGLIELIDTWNGTGYPRTGVWLVNAGLDDHLDLVATHRDRLPVFELDPNPYWTGFYATRPGLKRACRDLGRDLVRLDALRVRHRVQATGSAPDPCRAARWTAAAANHHDLITGTSPDRTVRREQQPWLDRARRDVATALGRDRTADPPGVAGGRDVVVERHGTLAEVATTHFTATFDEAHGGTLTRLVDTTGTDRVHPRSVACVAVADSGGLWRLGAEFPGGRWRPVASSADHPATVHATRDDHGVTVRIDATLEHRPVRILVEFPDAEPVVGVVCTVVPRLRRTVTLQWRDRGPTGDLVMHQPGAVVERPLARRYEPTFWPLHSWAVTGGGLGVATAVATAVHAQPTGTLETVVARTAFRELAWGVVPLLGPAMGRERGPQRAGLVFGWTADPAGPGHRLGRRLQARADRTAGRIEPAWPVHLEDPDVEIATVKPADRGDGVIVRIRNWEVDGRTVTLQVGPQVPIATAWRCDSNERDHAALEVSDTAVAIRADAHLITVRLVGPDLR